MLKALQPAELELALASLRELESRDQTIMRQWQMRLERAEYEVALAERRYQECDPSNRLVASTLERRWNDALLQLQDLKKQAAEFQRKEEEASGCCGGEKASGPAASVVGEWGGVRTTAQ